jgi:hypothetical protein
VPLLRSQVQSIQPFLHYFFPASVNTSSITATLLVTINPSTSLVFALPSQLALDLLSKSYQQAIPPRPWP